MAEYQTGETLYMQFLGTGGTVEIQAKYNTLDVKAGAQTVDITSGADVWRRYLVGKKEWSVSYEAFQTGLDAGMSFANQAVLANGAQGTLTVAPLGTAVGKYKYYGSVIIENRDQSFPFDNAAKVSLSFKGNGILNEGSY